MSEKRFLLHVSLGGKPSKDRIREAAIQIKSLLGQLSPDHQLAYTSSDGGTFGFFLISSLKAIQITARINNPGREEDRKSIQPSPLRTEDSLFVIEIGTDAAAVGKSKLSSWLRFHRPETTKDAQSAIARPQPNVPSQLANQLAAMKDKLSKS